MLKHIFCACKISQCDNKLINLITQKWFEIERTGYFLYYMQGFHIHQRRWPRGTTPKRSHTCICICANYINMTFAQTQYESNVLLSVTRLRGQRSM